MTMYLLDTNVISAVSPRRHRDDRTTAVARWLEANSEGLWLSVITASEVASGIAKAHRSGAVRHAAELHEWWDEIAYGFADRILPLDLAAAKLAGEMLDRARAGGVEPGFEDAAIAAIAERAGLTVLTRNARHFAPLGAAHLDPFKALPR